ncbi:hypothetical protein CHS0354_007918 [Potamilus streckersoni]|uniref:Uncharacterized protein n=1 Tax=Potamilus streckersoni TaxID=2493646 RepID=A0AAE0VRL0_9BIVA|nr:hypothetical protein CHS0354_007918 [Potamilus streckersoni]
MTTEYEILKPSTPTMQLIKTALNTTTGTLTRQSPSPTANDIHSLEDALITIHQDNKNRYLLIHIWKETNSHTPNDAPPPPREHKANETHQQRPHITTQNITNQKRKFEQGMSTGTQQKRQAQTVQAWPSVSHDTGKSTGGESTKGDATTQGRKQSQKHRATTKKNPHHTTIITGNLSIIATPNTPQPTYRRDGALIETNNHKLTKPT